MASRAQAVPHGTDSRRAHALAVACALLAGLLAIPAASAADVTFGTGGSRAKVKDMALMESPSGTYSDKYTADVYFKGGGDFYFSIHQRSFGVGEEELVVQTRWRPKKGEAYRTEQKLSRSEWSQTVGDTIDIQMGRHRLTGTPKKWTIIAEEEDRRFELTFTPTAPPWRPGDGRAEFGSDYLDMTVLAPRASVTGTLKVGDRVEEVKGRAYALHTYSTLAPHELAKRMVGFRTEKGELAFFFKEIEPADRWSGAGPVRWLLAAADGKVVFETCDFTLTPADIEPDDKHPNRYPVPHLFKLEAKDGDRTFEAVVKATRLKERSDRLEDVSKLKRAVAAQFAQPVYYSFDAAYQARLRAPDGEKTWEGRGVYELDHVNK